MPAATFPMKRGTIPFAPPTDGLSEKTQDTAVSCVLFAKRIDAYQTGKQLLAKISVDDTSVLNDSTENIITLVTCVMNQPDYRWCVQARQK